MNREIENIDRELSILKGGNDLNCSDSFTDDLLVKIDKSKPSKKRVIPAVFLVVFIVILNAGSIIFMNNYSKPGIESKTSSLKLIINAYSLNSYENNLKLSYQFSQTGDIENKDQN